MTFDDFSALRERVYSGRGITFGMTPDGNAFVGYSLTGRSASSQARKLVYDIESQVVRTEVTDEEQLKKGNPALLIYPAIAAVGNRIVASNGAQTKLLINSAKSLDESKNPSDIILNAFLSPVHEGGIDITSYEPDAPNYTPRISACLDNQSAAVHIVRRRESGEANPVWGRFSLTPGKARLITTYSGGNENPLLPFDGNALAVGINSSSAFDICQSIYDAIGNPNPLDNNKVYRVSAAVMMAKPSGLEVAVMNMADIGE